MTQEFTPNNDNSMDQEDRQLLAQMSSLDKLKFGLTNQIRHRQQIIQTKINRKQISEPSDSERIEDEED